VNTRAKFKEYVRLSQWVDLCADDDLGAPGVAFGVYAVCAAPRPPKPRATRGRAKESMAVNATSAPSNGTSASDASPFELDTPSKPALPSTMPSLPPNGQDVCEPPAKDDGGAEGDKNRRGRMLKEDKDAQVAASAELDEPF
jgi:hypothetical protein